MAVDLEGYDVAALSLAGVGALNWLLVGGTTLLGLDAFNFVQFIASQVGVSVIEPLIYVASGLGGLLTFDIIGRHLE